MTLSSEPTISAIVTISVALKFGFNSCDCHRDCDIRSCNG